MYPIENSGYLFAFDRRGHVYPEEEPEVFRAILNGYII